MITPNPLVSVVIPYYNAPRWLPETLSSLQNQTYRNFEIILVDDCSPGLSAEQIVADTELNLPQLTILRLERNLGTAGARNFGVENSRGELILPLDCDDIIEPEFLALTVRVLADSAFDCVFTHVNIIGDGEGTYIPTPEISTLLSGHGATNSFLYRREVFKQVGGYNENVFYSELAFWIAAIYAGNKFTKIDSALVGCRKRAEGRWNKSERARIVEDLFEEYKEIYQSNLKDVLSTQSKNYWQVIDHTWLLNQEYARLIQNHRNLFKELQETVKRKDAEYEELLSEHLKVANQSELRQKEFDNILDAFNRTSAELVKVREHHMNLENGFQNLHSEYEKVRQELTELIQKFDKLLRLENTGPVKALRRYLRKFRAGS